MEEEENGRTDIRVLLRPARYPCECGECRPEVVPVVVGVLPALVVTFAEEKGRLSLVHVDSTGPETLEELAEFLSSLAESLTAGDVLPLDGGDGGD